MTSRELYQELFRQLTIISADDELMRKAVKALKRIVGKAEQNDATEMSREEFMARVKQAERGKEIGFKNIEEIDRYVRNL